MKKKQALRILYVALGTVVLVLILALLGVTVFANQTVGKAISAGASKALGVDVTVGDVSLSLLKGEIELNDLIIDNPKGYNHKTFLTLGQAHIAVNTKSLLSDTVEITAITLDGVDVVMEQKGLTNNVQDLVETINNNSQPGKEPSGKKLVINTLDITSTSVKVKLLPVPGKADTLTFKLAPIRLKNLGENKVMDTSAVTSRIILALAGGIVEQGLDILPKDLLETTGKALGATAQLGVQLINTGGKAGGEVVKGVGRLGGGLIKGLLSKKTNDTNEPNDPNE